MEQTQMKEIPLDVIEIRKLQQVKETGRIHHLKSKEKNSSTEEESIHLRNKNPNNTHTMHASQYLRKTNIIKSPTKHTRHGKPTLKNKPHLVTYK